MIGRKLGRFSYVINKTYDRNFIITLIGTVDKGSYLMSGLKKLAKNVLFLDWSIFGGNSSETITRSWGINGLLTTIDIHWCRGSEWLGNDA